MNFIPFSCKKALAPLSATIAPFTSNIMSGFTNKEIFCMISSFDKASCTRSSIYFRILKAIIPMAAIAVTLAIIIINSDVDLGMNILRWVYVGMSFWLWLVVLFVFLGSHNGGRF